MPEYASLIIPCCINDAYIVVMSNACENVSRLLSKVCWEHVYKGAPFLFDTQPPYLAHGPAASVLCNTMLANEQVHRETVR